MEADSILRKRSTVPKPAEFKVESLVGEDLPLERIVSIG